jgi:hypothetical protein
MRMSLHNLSPKILTSPSSAWQCTIQALYQN